jgi:hypothetical protein
MLIFVRIGTPSFHHHGEKKNRRKVKSSLKQTTFVLFDFFFKNFGINFNKENFIWEKLSLFCNEISQVFQEIFLGSWKRNKKAVRDKKCHGRDLKKLALKLVFKKTFFLLKLISSIIFERLYYKIT